VIADLFTLNQGRVSAIVHGARKSQGKQPAKRALVQAFTPLMVTFTGRGELRTSLQFEAAGAPLNILGNRLYSGLYVNELLLKLLALDDPYPNLFAYYQALLNQLTTEAPIEQCLRPFEVHLMDELGYHMVLDRDYITDQPVAADACYEIHPLLGVCLKPKSLNSSVDQTLISGKLLLKLAASDYTDGESLKVAKYMARVNLDQLLGGQLLQSRNLFHPVIKR